MKKDVIVIDEDILEKDDGTLYHTDITSTIEKRDGTAPDTFWRTNNAVHLRPWAEKS